MSLPGVALPRVTAMKAPIPSVSICFWSVTLTVVRSPARKFSRVPRYVTDRSIASPGSPVRNTFEYVFAHP